MTVTGPTPEPGHEPIPEPLPEPRGIRSGPLRLLDRVLSLLLPAPCLGCGDELPATGASLGLCPACRDALKSPASAGGGLCARCARPLEAAALPAGWECGGCRRHPPSHDRLLAAWSYEPPLDAVVRALKFRRLDYLGPHLGRALLTRLAGGLERAADGAVAVVPLPLHWRRRLHRGFNQAELLARPVARHLGLPLLGGLRRRRSRPAQSSLTRRRRSGNPRGAFRWWGALPQGPVVLVDDVVTTGATLEAAAACLKAAGVPRVVAVVAARTPLAAERRGGGREFAEIESAVRRSSV